VNRVTSPSQRGPVIRLGWLGLVICLALLAGGFSAFGETGETQPAAPYATVPGGLPDAGYSVLRVFGALMVVISIFFGGIWLFRNWQRVALRKGGAPRLNVIEVRSLGQRHALYVVGYDQQRMLLASSPAGVTLVSHLPAAEEAEAAAAATAVPTPSFAVAFQQVFLRKS
jgi:flagellar biogenesis protein FliO